MGYVILSLKWLSTSTWFKIIAFSQNQALGMNRHKGMGTSWRESNQNYVTIKQQIHSIETVTQING